MTFLTDPLIYLFAIPAVVAMGLSKGGFAGIGMASTPLLALVLPPLEAAAILLPILLLQDAISCWFYRRTWDAWNLKVMLPGAAIGVLAAWALASYISDAAIRLAIGVIALVFCANAFLRRNQKFERIERPNPLAGAFWGSLSGFTSAFSQIGAPPYFIFVLPQRLEKLTYVGTTVFFFALVNLMKVGPYFALGQFSPGGFGTSLLLAPLAVASNFLGIWLVRITPERLFYRITYGVVFVLGVVLTFQGLREMLG